MRRTCGFISLFLFLLDFALVSSQFAEKQGHSRRCSACLHLVHDFLAQINSTDENYAIQYGYRLGPDGQYRPRTTVDYEKSEIRLMEILDTICDTNIHKNTCYDVLADVEADLEEYYRSLGEEVEETSEVRDLADELCHARMSDCDRDAPPVSVSITSIPTPVDDPLGTDSDQTSKEEL